MSRRHRRLHLIGLVVVSLVAGTLVAGPPSLAQQPSDPGPPQSQRSSPPSKPTEIAALRSRDAKHLANPDGSFTAVIGRNMHYEAAPGRFEEVDLTLRADGGEHVADKAQVMTRVSARGVEATDRTTGKGIRWITPGRPLVVGRHAAVADQGLAWEYTPARTGLKLGAVVQARKGPKTYTFSYQLLGRATDLSVGPGGELVSDAFVVPRALAIGIDARYFPAGPWRLLAGQRVAFDFDDSTIPTRSMPYQLDPTTSFGVSAGADDGEAVGFGAAYPPPVFQPFVDNVFFAPRRTRHPDGNFEIRNGLLRWDTSSLPDDAVVSDASLRIALCGRAIDNNRSLSAEWYTNWPIDNADYTTGAQTTALAGLALNTMPVDTDFAACAFGQGPGTENLIPLTSTFGVNKTSFSGLRLHVSGGQPAGDNYALFASAEHAYSPEPRLEVNYVSLSPTLLSALVAQSNELGLEQFAPYAELPLGNATGRVHLRTGNLVIQQDDVVIPRAGLNVVVRRSYNSADPERDSGMGRGWSLSVADASAGLEGIDATIADIDLGAEIKVADISTQLVGGVLQLLGQMIEFTDGDGTTHRFVRSGGPGSRWSSPPGVSLRVREVPLSFPQAYELIRPDGVAYRVDNLKGPLGLPSSAWRVTSVTDRRANQLRYEYASFGGKLRLRSIFHVRQLAQALVRFDYDGAGQLTQMVSLPGATHSDPATNTVVSSERRHVFSSPAGRLTGVVHNDQATTAEAGRRTTGFGYHPVSGRLNSLTDARGNTTTFGYSSDTEGRLETVVDRRGKTWGFSYGPLGAGGARTTTVRRPLGFTGGPSDPNGDGSVAVSYTISGRGPVAPGDPRITGGNIVAIADEGAGGGPVTSSYIWVQNRLVTTTDGVGNQVLSEYNDLGLVTKLTRPAPNGADRADLSGPSYPKVPVVATLGYRFPPGYQPLVCGPPLTAPPDPRVSFAGYCEAVADVNKVVAADNVVAQRRVTDLVVSNAGLVLSSTQRAAASGTPASGDRTWTMAYWGRGLLCSADGPRNDVVDVTRYGSAASNAGGCGAGADPAYGGYDDTGQPTRITDAVGKFTDLARSPYGPVGRRLDRDLRTTRWSFDARDNPLEMTDPIGDRWQARYDANDNLTTLTTPRGLAPGSSLPDDFQTRTTYDANDWPSVVSGPGATPAAPRVEVSSTYADDGAVSSSTNAVGGVTTAAYHPNRMLAQLSAPATTAGPKAVTDHSYDAAGRMVSTTFPAVDAVGTRPQTTVTYSPQSRPSLVSTTSSTGALVTTKMGYNAHGEELQTLGPRQIGGESQTTEWDRDSFGQPTATRRRLVGRFLSTPTTYDTAGNAITTSALTGSPAAGNAQVLTSAWRYDALNRLAYQAADPTNLDHEVLFAYEAEGAQTARLDLRQTAGPPAGVCGDVGVACAVARTVATSYNPDGTTSRVVSTDEAGGSLASCNGAYDPDKHLLGTTTVLGGAGCSGGSIIATTSMGWDDRGLMVSVGRSIRSPATGQMVSRNQSYTWRNDATAASLTHDNKTTTYGRSPAGWVESATDWAGRVSTFAYSPSGGLTASSLGSGAATSTRAHHPDGSLSALVWRGRGGAVLSNTSTIAYDSGGLRIAENRSLTQPGSADDGGPAAWGYDLIGRLTSYTSPFRLAAGDTAEPHTTYSLDDGANIVSEATTVAGASRASSTATYPNGRLGSRNADPGGGVAPSTTTFGYSPLGEETSRILTGPGAGTTTTSYDPAGHVNVVDDQRPAGVDVDYTYDGTDHLLARQQVNPPGPTTLYFTWGMGQGLAEETDGAGTTKVAYLNDGAGGIIAQQMGTGGTWTWLADDSDANLATQAADNGSVVEQRPFDPYGRPETAGMSKTATAPGSSLGFQATLTDPTTGAVLLGPRQYDPATARFATADSFVSSAAELGLATDPLTSNRYIFAAANPVAFYEDGHGPCPPWAHRERASGSHYCKGNALASGAREVGGVATVASSFALDVADFGLSAISVIESTFIGLLELPPVIEDLAPIAFFAGGIRALLRRIRTPGRLGAPGNAIGLANDAVGSAYEGMRSGGGHAMRNLMDEGLIPNAGSLASRAEAFQDLTAPILRSPSSTFNWRLGDTAARGFAGQAGGRQVVVFVAKEGPYQGRVISAVVPDAKQVAQWGL